MNRHATVTALTPGMAMVDPRKATPNGELSVHHRLDGIGKHIQILEEKLDELRSRLSFVLAPEYPVVGEADLKGEGESPLAELIFETQGRIRHLQDLVDDIMARLQI